jgi:hypothetical protein
VLLDEVETLAADRSKMSLEANPIDVHRATDAVLVQLDTPSDQYPNLLFIATSNFQPCLRESGYLRRQKPRETAAFHLSRGGIPMTWQAYTHGAVTGSASHRLKAAGGCAPWR